jgi:outer membrane receptor protein involved in Fe transport
MFKRSKVCTGVLVALGGALLAAPAWAQGERVEITGSRIKTIGAVSNSPITSISADEINAQQPAAVEEVIRGLPAAIPAIGPGTNNGSNGTASIDLRGLGTNRTLVLVNGRRIVPATLGGVVDTNSIPVALLERIDLVTGGASAVYGADAVAGVVNFVLKKNFSGVEASASYGLSENNDAKRYRADLTMGANFGDGRGNAAVSIGTTRTDPLRQGDRDIGKVSLSSTTGAAQGSGTDVPAQFLSLPGGLGTRQINPATGLLEAPGPGFNFNPQNYYVTPLERTQLTGLANFTVNDNLEAYTELMYTKSSVTLNLASSGTFFNSYTVPIGNPFIPDPARQQLCTAFNIASANCVAGDPTPINLTIGRRITEFGPRINDFDNNSHQFLFGVRGALPVLNAWSYDANYLKGQSEQVSYRIAWGSLSKVRQALNATNTTTCAVNTGGCVPLNVFGPAGSITPAMLNFIGLSAIQTTKVTQSVGSLTFSGDLGAVKSPLARSPIGVVIGGEQREVVGGNVSDAPSQIQGEVLGTGAPTPDRRGSLKLNEVYGEVIAPIIEGKPFAHSLSLEGGFRNTNFKTEVSGRTYDSWKYGLEYAPIKGLRFRAMQQRATRAPNVNELYAPVITGLANLAVDPCAPVNGVPVSGALRTLCLATGVPANVIDTLAQPSAGQINNTSGGNPNVGPEEADTTTVGLVWEPEFLPGLSLTLDYYKIDIDKAITSPTANQVLNGCYSAAQNPSLSPANVFCGLIARNPNTGTFNGSDTIGVRTQLSNLGKIWAEGYDLGVNYRFALGAMGRLDVGLQATQATKWKFQSLPTVPVLDCLGYYGTSCGGPTAKMKFNQRTSWNFGDFTLGYVWRHLGKVSEEPGGTNYLPAYSTIKAYDYVDLNAAWNVTKNIRLALTVLNAFDKDAPVVGNTIATTSTNSGNTFPQWYDVVGRYYSFSARVKF